MTQQQIIEELQKWVRRSEDRRPVSNWSNGFQAAVSDVKGIIERLKRQLPADSKKRPDEPYKFS